VIGIIRDLILFWVYRTNLLMIGTPRDYIDPTHLEYWIKSGWKRMHAISKLVLDPE
jgi:hypothetical protein